MDRPWLKLFTRDWLDDPVLRRCSPLARSILVDLMCLAQEGAPYGHLADRLGSLTEIYMASRCFVTEVDFKTSIHELITLERVHKTDSGVLFIKRMVRDEEVRLRRAEGGKLGGNPGLVNLEVNLKEPQRLTSKDNHKVKQTTEGYPSNPTNDGSEGYLPSRAHVSRALTLTLSSDSSSDSEKENTQDVSVSKSGNGKHATWKRDKEFAGFQEIYLTTGKAITEYDWAEAWQEWRVLDFEQKTAAISGVTARINAGLCAEPQFVYLPKNYLKRREWTRAISKRKPGTRDELEAYWNS